MFKAALSTIKDALPEEVKEAAKKRVNQWKGISPDEALVREATNSDKWGPHGEQLKAIARLTHDGRWPLVQSVLEERMKLRGERWRQVYKALSVIEYLVASGTERVPRDVQSSRYLEGLLTFEYRDSRGKDEGVNVRQRAEKIKALIEDPRSIEEAREKAARNRGKYSGMSSAEARHHRSMGSLSTNDSGSFSKNSSRGLGDATSAVARESGETERRDFTPSVASQQNHTNVSSQSATSNATTVETAGLSSSSSHAQSTESRHDAFASQPAAGAVPKIIFRDVPIRRDEVPQQLSAFEPPPRASSAAIQAVNYSSGMSGATAAPAAPTSAGSIDDLLGGLSAQSAPVPSSAPVTNPSSSLADLDSLYGAPPSMPQAAGANTNDGHGSVCRGLGSSEHRGARGASRARQSIRIRDNAYARDGVSAHTDHSARRAADSIERSVRFVELRFADRRRHSFQRSAFAEKIRQRNGRARVAHGGHGFRIESDAIRADGRLPHLV